MMGIFLYGCRQRRSSSPVIMQVALQIMASSRNLLSLGSLQSVISSETSYFIIRLSNLAIKASRRSSERYLSNFYRKITSDNSSSIGSEAARSPDAIALSKATAGVEFFIRAALINLFTSKTYLLRFIFQNFIQFLLCQSFYFHFISQFVQKLYHVCILSFINYRSNLTVNKTANIRFEFLRSATPFIGGGIVYINNDFTHGPTIMFTQIYFKY